MVNVHFLNVVQQCKRYQTEDKIKTKLMQMLKNMTVQIGFVDEMITFRQEDVHDL